MTNIGFAISIFVIFTASIFSAYCQPLREILLFNKVSLSDSITWFIAVPAGIAFALFWFKSSEPLSLSRWASAAGIILLLLAITHFAFDYLDNYPNKLLTMDPRTVYFLDEKLSHYLVYTALAVFLCFLPFSRMGAQGTLSAAPGFFILGALLGIPVGISIIEGQSPYLWVVLSFAGIGVLVFLSKRYEFDPQTFALVLSLFISSTFAMLSYAVIFGEFKEMSELLLDDA